MWTARGSNGRQSLVAIAVLGVLPTCFTACSGQEQATMEIIAQQSLQEPTELGGLRLTVDGHTLTADDFDDPSFPGFGRTRFSVPNSGELHIDLELFQEGEVVASGRLAVQMQPGYFWRLGVSRWVGDPTLPGCLGCSVKQDFPIESEWQNAPDERVWIIGGGGPKDSSIVF